MTTVPGYSSRSSSPHIQQFPQRDEASMSAHNPDPGFSNSEAVKQDAATGRIDSSADALQAYNVEPGYSNGDSASKSDDTAAVSEEPKKSPAKKSAAKKSAKKS